MSLAPTTPDRKNTTAKQQTSTSTHSKSLDTANDSNNDWTWKTWRRGLLETVKIFEPIHAFSQNKTWQKNFFANRKRQKCENNGRGKNFIGRNSSRRNILRPRRKNRLKIFSVKNVAFDRRREKKFGRQKSWRLEISSNIENSNLN